MNSTAGTLSRYAAFLRGEFNPAAGAAQPEPDNKNYNLLKSGDSKATEPMANSSSQENKNFKNYKHDHREVWRKIHSDEKFKLAINPVNEGGWGFDTDTMMACYFAYGEFAIKELIHKVSRLSNSYFRQGQSIPEQRARILGAELKKLRQRQAG